MLYCFHITTWWLIFYVQVFATDADSHQPLNIVYFLAGQGVDSADPATGNFAIDKTSGEIFVLKVGGNAYPSLQPSVTSLVFVHEFDVLLKRRVEKE